LKFSSYDICEDFGSSSHNLAWLDLTEQEQVCVELELTEEKRVWGKGSSLDHDLNENNRLWYWIWYASWFNGWVKRLIIINKYKNFCLVIFVIDFEEYVNFDNYMNDWLVVKLVICWLMYIIVDMWNCELYWFKVSVCWFCL